MVETSAGRLTGLRREGHLAFLGIPYAAPPIGRLRFAAPAPVEGWKGVREATRFGASCPQPPSLLAGMDPGAQDEDCLHLNVWTPAADRARRPVLVWIHGGGFVTGSGSQAIYDGGALARRGDIVVVTINYRLGALGFLAPEGNHGATLNSGLLDQVRALEWVRDNIEACGGDPGNVTVFGESAGAMSVATLMGMPAAAGLFHKAVAQSGAASATLAPEQAARTAHELARTLGLERADAERLRAIPATALLEAQSAVIAQLQRENFLVFAPVVDPATLPLHPLQAIAAGSARGVALLTGTTRDEWRLFTFALPEHRKLDDDGLARRIGHRLHQQGHDATRAEALIATYRTARPTAPVWQIFDAIETDRLFRMPALGLLDAHRRGGAHASWLYRFDRPSPAARGLLGACHAIELPYVFGSLDAPGMDRFAGAGPDAAQLSETVMDAWITFARAGVPQAAQLPAWPAWNEAAQPSMRLSEEFALIDDPDPTERRAWQTLAGVGA